MRNSNHAIDVRKLQAIVECELGDRGDLHRLMAGAHAGRYDQNKITRADASIPPSVTHERRAFFFGNIDGSRSGQVLGKVPYERYVIRHNPMGKLLAALDAK